MTAPVYTDRPEDLTYEEYLAEQTAIMAALAAVLVALSLPYQAPRLAPPQWISYLASIFPYVNTARFQSGVLARRFYDAERARLVGRIVVPSLREVLGPDNRPILLDDRVGIVNNVFERWPVFVAEYDPNWFQDAMNAAKPVLSQPNATDDDVARVVSIASKEAEQGGRKTILRAVDSDPKTIGWARVEGTENVGSCGFCSMLISRGPVYKEAEDAGLDLRSNTEAVEIFKQAEESGSDAALMRLMNRWHENCDCKVVPVFDRKNWKGRDQYEEFERLWISTTRGVSGNDALNAFRRAIENGDGVPIRRAA